MTITRRRLCAAGATALVGALAGCSGETTDPEPADAASEEWSWSGTLPVDDVVQHYDPACNCCAAYADYLEANGITVTRKTTDDRDAIRTELGVPDDAASCHTVEFGDYLVEGHVPLEAIETLLEERPAVDGVSTPGMPRYAPGMGPRGDDPLPIYSFTASGDLDEYVTV